MPGWFGFKNLDRPTLNPPFDIKVNIGGVFFDPNDLMVFLVVPIVLVALALFMRYARVGIAIRAAAERADRASTLGIPVGRVQATVWVITTVLAFITVFLRAGVADFPIGSALGDARAVRARRRRVGRMDNFRASPRPHRARCRRTGDHLQHRRDLYVPVPSIIVLGLLLNRAAAAGSTTRRCRRGGRECDPSHRSSSRCRSCGARTWRSTPRSWCSY
jgi:hypothetical protein